MLREKLRPQFAAEAIRCDDDVADDRTVGRVQPYCRALVVHASGGNPGTYPIGGELRGQ